MVNRAKWAQGSYPRDQDGKNKTQEQKETKRRNGKTITAVWSQGPQPRPLLSQTPAARSPTFPRVPGPLLANPSSFPPSLLPHLALSGLKLQGMSLSSTAASTGKSQAPHPCHFCSELLTPVYPQLTLLTLFIFPWQQWPRKSHPTPICPSTKKKKGPTRLMWH